MAGKDRKSILDYTYKLQNGKERKRSELIVMIKDSIKKGNFTTSQISQNIRLDIRHLQNIIRHMMDKDIIASARGNTKGGGYVYSLRDECLLADLFMPKVKDVEKSFKVNSRKTYKVEDGTSRSSGNKNVISYCNSHYDSVHWG